MENVRAKFVCDSVEPVEGEQKVVNFRAVTSGSEENKSFSRWTPSANLQMYISNETQAGNYFEPGKEYYVDFTAVD